MRGDQSILDVQLSFTMSDEGVLIRWESSLLGSRESSFECPFSPDDQALLVQAFDEAQFCENKLSRDQRVHLARLNLADSEALDIAPDIFQKVGHRLFQALLADEEAAQAFRIVRDGATATGRGLAWHLVFPPEAVELAALPWELLSDGGTTPVILQGGVLASFTRHLALDEAIPPVRVTSPGPLRILAITPRADTSSAASEARREEQLQLWRELQAIGLAEVHDVQPATRRGLIDALGFGAAPDIVHFTGHGHHADGNSFLVFDKPGNGWDYVHAPELIALCRSVRMVVLSACHGSVIRGKNGLWTALAPALSAAGVPIVIGMQSKIRNTSAYRASRVIYRALSQKLSVQDAVNHARQALFVEDTESSSWYVPTLYIRSRNIEPVFV